MNLSYNDIAGLTDQTNLQLCIVLYKYRSYCKAYNFLNMLTAASISFVLSILVTICYHIRSYVCICAALHVRVHYPCQTGELSYSWKSMHWIYEWTATFLL